jgi:hypothetical protein
MRIENWELSIGQILPSPHSAKLFLREPLPLISLPTSDQLAEPGKTPVHKFHFGCIMTGVSCVDGLPANLLLPVAGCVLGYEV